MTHTRLLARLDRARAKTPQRLRDAVLENLRLLFNARRGAPASPGYGLPDLRDTLHRVPRATPLLRQQLATLIATYEPRLVDVVVLDAPARTPMEVRFEVQARLLDGHRAYHVHLQTTITPDDGVEITGS